jgi:hypothetical protein
MQFPKPFSIPDASFEPPDLDLKPAFALTPATSLRICGAPLFEAESSRMRQQALSLPFSITPWMVMTPSNLVGSRPVFSAPMLAPPKVESLADGNKLFRASRLISRSDML